MKLFHNKVKGDSSFRKIMYQGTKISRMTIVYENCEMEYVFPKPVLVGQLIKILRELGEKQYVK